MLLACYGYILLLLLVLTAAKIIRAIKNQNHSRNKPQSKNKKTPSSLQQRGPNNFLADKVHHHLQPALFLLLPLLKVPNASPPPPPAPGAYITRPQASTPFQSVLVFACPLSLPTPFVSRSPFFPASVPALGGDGVHLSLRPGAHHGCPRPQLLLWLR